MQDRTGSPQVPIEPLLLRTDEAARVLGIGRSTLYALIASGELPVVRIGRATRIPMAALVRWVEAHAVGGERGLSRDA